MLPAECSAVRFLICTALQASTLVSNKYRCCFEGKSPFSKVKADDKILHIVKGFQSFLSHISCYDPEWGNFCTLMGLYGTFLHEFRKL